MVREKRIAESFAERWDRFLESCPADCACYANVQ